MKSYLALASLLLCTACSSINSSDIKASGIHATNSVSATGGSVTCESTLRAGGGTGSYVDLDTGDALYCNGVHMKREGDMFGQISYRASVASSPRALYEIKLVHQGETLRSGAVMPSPITGARILGGTVHPIGSSVSVTWDPSQYADEGMEANLVMQDSTEKQFGGAKYTDSAPESGSATFTSNETVIKRYNDQTNSYDRVAGPYKVTIELRREKTGALEGAWKGSMRAHQSATIEAKFIE